MSMGKPKVCVLVGPTASGKTSASLAVAEALDMEIVSADSMQIYRGMDIGTAKAAPEERSRVPHHMIDIADPAEKYTAARYREEGRAALYDIFARGKMPLVVGGTGLYVSALIDEMNFAQAEGGGEERRRWQDYLADNGAEALHARLREVDPPTAQRLHPNDTRRVIRALEVYSLTGEAMSRQAGRGESPFDVRMAGLVLEREKLYGRIDERVLDMVRNGLIEEAKTLHAMGAQTAAQALGYKELFRVFRGECTLAQAVEAVQRDTRRYAKRQMTWFRRDPRVRWFAADDCHLTASLIDYFENG